MPRAENKEDLYFGPFHLSLVKRALWLGDGLVDLSPTEFEVLLALVESKSGALSAESLRTAAWHGQAVELNNVHQVIRRLRQKLGPDEDGRQYIVRNQAGYVLAANITSKGPQNAKENGPELADPAPEQRAVAESSVGIEVNGRAASHHGVPSPSDPSARPYDQPAPRAKPLGRSASLLALALLGIALSLLLVIAFHSHSPERHFVLQMKQLTIDGRAKGGPLVFDGGRLWFTEVLQGAWKVVSVAAAGGEAQPLNVPFKETFIWGKSGDGSELLLLSINEGEKKTWAWRLGGDDLRLLRSKPFTPSIESPDSQMTAFSDGNALVFARGGRVINRAVTPQGTVVSQIQWSPDSSHVSFALANNRLALATLFLADPFTSQAQPIAERSVVGEDQPSGAWAKDGRSYLLAAGSREMHDLWAVSNIASSRHPALIRPSRITNGAMNWGWPVAGKTASEVYAIGESQRSELVRRAQGSDAWQPYLDGIPAYELDVSRDGERVAYIHYPDHKLWIARANGTERVQIEWPDCEVHQPHWSPDGTRIALMGKPSDKWRVMIVEVATARGEVPLSRGEDQGVPSWTNDGRLVFGDWPTGDPRQVMKLHLLDLQQHRVSVLPASEGLWTVRSSPDGKYLAALSYDSKALLISKLGSSAWRQILSGDNLDDLMWSYDSEYVHVLQDRKLVRVDVLSGRVQEIADVRDFPFTHEQWFGLAPDGSSLALRGALGQEIYSLTWQP